MGIVTNTKYGSKRVGNEEEFKGNYDNKKTITFLEETKGTALSSSSATFACSSSAADDTIMAAAVTNNLKRIVFPKQGITLSYLNEFVEECGGMEKLNGLTTDQVIQFYIIPKTYESQSSWCEMLAKRQEQEESNNNNDKTTNFLGTAQVFVSHVHECLFTNLIQALQYRLRNKPQIVLWIDAFCWNQHDLLKQEWTYHDLNLAFRQGIQQIGRTILVLDRPILATTSKDDDNEKSSLLPFTRSWCLLEAYFSFSSTFEIAMGPKQSETYLEELTTNQAYCTKVNETLLQTLKCENGQASNSSEQELILDLLREEGEVQLQQQDQLQKQPSHKQQLDSVRSHDVTEYYDGTYTQDNSLAFLAPSSTACLDKIDSMIVTKFRQWMINTALAALKQCQASLAASMPARSGSSRLLSTFTSSNHMTPPAPSTPANDKQQRRRLGLLLAIYELYMLQSGRQANSSSSEYYYYYMEKAQNYGQECLECSKAVLGKGHTDTLSIMNKLAVLYQCQGNYEQAQTLLEECLQHRKATLGETHPRTLDTMNNLAVTLDSRGGGPGAASRARKYSQQAQELLEDCLSKQKQTLGVDHKDTLGTMNNLANILASQKKYHQAQKLLVVCLERYQNLLGPNHCDTLKTMNNLAHTFESQNKFRQAQELLQDCLEREQNTLGKYHGNTLGTLNNLAHTFQKQQFYGPALELFQTCLEGRIKVLGKSHPDTLSTLNNVAAMYKKLGHMERARQLFKDCLDRRRVVLGKNHPKTLTTARHYKETSRTIRKEKIVGLFCKSKKRRPSYRASRSSSLTCRK